MARLMAGFVKIGVPRDYLNENYNNRAIFLAHLIQELETKQPGIMWHFINTLYELGEFDIYLKEIESVLRTMNLSEKPK